MKTIKRISPLLFAVAVILLSASACVSILAFYAFCVINNSSSDVYFKCPSYPPRVQYCIYPDTTLRFTINESNRICVDGSYTRNTSRRTLEEWFSYFPNDTVSLFFFDPEVVASNSWETVVDEYLVLQRYDLSIEDFRKLDGFIPYPPTPEMKDMHMFPPYGVREENE